MDINQRAALSISHMGIPVTDFCDLWQCLGGFYQGAPSGCYDYQRVICQDQNSLETLLGPFWGNLVFF